MLSFSATSATTLTSPMETRLERHWVKALDLASPAFASDCQIGPLALAKASSSGQESRASAKEQRLAMPWDGLKAAVKSNGEEYTAGGRRVSE